jgi:hypothetical protein
VTAAAARAGRGRVFRVECAAACNVTFAGLRFTGGRAAVGSNSSSAFAAAAAAAARAGNASEAAAACGGYGEGGGCVLVVGRGGDSDEGTWLRMEQCAVVNCSARCGGGVMVRPRSAAADLVERRSCRAVAL